MTSKKIDMTYHYAMLIRFLLFLTQVSIYSARAIMRVAIVNGAFIIEWKSISFMMTHSSGYN